MREMLEEESKSHVEENLTLEPGGTPAIRENYYCVTLGYADKTIERGERIYMRPNEMMILYKILKREFDK